jgi:hypothetical protein
VKTLTVFVVLLSAPALAGETTYVFRSEEDPATPPDPAVCAAAPFLTNVPLGASLWSFKTRHKNGAVTQERVRRIGTATACLQLTNVLFPQGLVQNFFVRFELPGGTYDAVGTCTVDSNNVPVPFIVLAGCTLQLISGPRGSLGGSAISSSIFNPLHKPGFATGSVWTLHNYWAEPPPDPDRDGDHDDD